MAYFLLNKVVVPSADGGDELINVEVRVFANLRENIPAHVTRQPEQPFAVQLQQGESLSHLLAKIGVPQDVVVIALVNGLRKPLDYILQDGDRVGFFPPLGGG